MDAASKKIVLSIAAYKLCLLTFVAALPWLWPGSFNLGNFTANFHWPTDAAPTYADLFRTWDAQHFLYIARHGYEPGSLSNNFYPLWPWLIRAAGGGLPAALILSNLLSLGALMLFYRQVKEERNGALARCSLLVLLAHPGAFFLCLPFSESLFFLLVMVMFSGLSRGRWALAAAAALLLPVCRPQGILVALPYWHSLRESEKTRFEDAPLWLCPLAGVAVYLFCMLRSTGDAFEGFRAYRDIFPGNPSLLKLLDPLGFARNLAHVESWHGTSGSLMERLWFLLFAACLPALWRRDRALFLYALPMGLVPAAALSFVSFTRHLLLVFPVFIVAAEFLQRRPPVVRRAFLAAAWALQLFLLARHANNYWVA